MYVPRYIGLCQYYKDNSVQIYIRRFLHLYDDFEKLI